MVVTSPDRARKGASVDAHNGGLHPRMPVGVLGSQCTLGSWGAWPATVTTAVRMRRGCSETLDYEYEEGSLFGSRDPLSGGCVGCSVHPARAMARPVGLRYAQARDSFAGAAAVRGGRLGAGRRGVVPRGRGAMADWAPVVLGVVLFVLLSPGLLFTIPGNTKHVEFGSLRTNGKAIFIHTVIFFAVFTILILALHVHIYTG
ncbi:hypothetical protein Taro_039536 [Colocasia esculenta]|uniref:Transmembrane protein n=1 Tax=Colocasia esculenta TaxID=4460 RepID=A0A843WAX0_COLES|nr:hypothetical protein [Colocasia esculenta]